MRGENVQPEDGMKMSFSCINLQTHYNDILPHCFRLTLVSNSEWGSAGSLFPAAPCWIVHSIDRWGFLGGGGQW